MTNSAPANLQSSERDSELDKPLPPQPDAVLLEEAERQGFIIAMFHKTHYGCSSERGCLVSKGDKVDHERLWCFRMQPILEARQQGFAHGRSSAPLAAGRNAFTRGLVRASIDYAEQARLAVRRVTAEQVSPTEEIIEQIAVDATSPRNKRPAEPGSTEG